MLGVAEPGVCSMICINVWLFPDYTTIKLGIHESEMLLFWLTGAVLQICKYHKQIVENGNKESKKQRRSNNTDVHLTLEKEEFFFIEQISLFIV